MNDKQLRHFLLLTREGSFSKAADCAFLSVPSFKAQMDQLEAELGMPLFVRSNRGIKLTQAGHLLQEYAQDHIQHTDAFLSQLHSCVQNANDIHIGFNDEHVRDFVYYDALSVYKRLHPHTDITLEAASGFDMDKYDVFLGFPDEHASALKRSLLTPFPLHCILPARLDIAAKPSLCIEDLSGQIVRIPPARLLSRIAPDLSKALSEQGISFKEISNAPTEYNIQCLTKDYVYIIVGKEISIPAPLVQRPLSDFSFSHYIYTSSRSIKRPVVKAYLDFLIAYYREHFTSGRRS